MIAALRAIYEEIEQLDPAQADVELLEGLLDNALFLLACLSAPQRQGESWECYRGSLEQILNELLNTTHKEMLWAKQEQEEGKELQYWFEKAQKQVLKDMQIIWSFE